MNFIHFFTVVVEPIVSLMPRLWKQMRAVLLLIHICDVGSVCVFCVLILLFSCEAFLLSNGKRESGWWTHPGPRGNKDDIRQHPRHLWRSHQNKGIVSKWTNYCGGVTFELVGLTCYFLCMMLCSPAWPGRTSVRLARGEECRRRHSQICEFKLILLFSCLIFSCLFAS